MTRTVAAAAAGLDSIELSPAEFELIQNLARERFGLDLRHGKEELVRARLGKLIRQSGFGSFHGYYQHVIRDRTGEALSGMINALTTNFTSFQREPAHFRFLVQTLIPQWRRRPSLSFWSAACASGEEPYTLAFTLLWNLPPSDAPAFRILATDISTRALEAARRAVYPAERVQELPPEWLPRFFLKGHGASEGLLKVKPEVRRLIDFRKLNLVEPFSHPEPFTVIFCRNVMIYFDRTVRQKVVEKLAAALEPGGYLFVGHSESLAGLKTGLEYVRPAIYRRPADGSPADGKGRRTR